MERRDTKGFWTIDDDVVSLQCRDRHEVHIGEFESGCKADVVAPYLLKNTFLKINDVHLVNGNDDVLDTKQRDNE